MRLRSAFILGCGIDVERREQERRGLPLRLGVIPHLVVAEQAAITQEQRGSDPRRTDLRLAGAAEQLSIP
jgi:hypothetical protein